MENIGRRRVRDFFNAVIESADYFGGYCADRVVDDLFGSM